MKIKTIPIADIKRAKYNPRKVLKPGDPAYKRLKTAIETFGLVEPLVLNERTGVLVGGHQRLTVLEDMGRKEAEVSLVDLDDKAEKALNLALNKQGGEWDVAALSDLLVSLPGVDLDVIGFDSEEFLQLTGEVTLKPVSVPRPPKMSWALIGIPTVQYGEIAETIRELATPFQESSARRLSPMSAGKKTDNHNLASKLVLRRHFLNRYHRENPPCVMDCCQGSGVIWRVLRKEFKVARYWGIDVKAEPGRLSLDSERVLCQPGWTEDIIDVEGCQN